jgi:hypothetical protein
MKKLFACFALIVGIALTIQAQSDETPYQTKEFNLPDRATVQVETVGGNISVTGQSSGKSRVEMYVRSNAWKEKLSEEEIKERLENFDISMNQDGNTLRVSAKPKQHINWNKKSLSISFKLFVPKQVSTHLETQGGNIALANLTGTQDALTRGGNISQENSTGNSSLETAGGNISVRQFDGKLNVTCSGGNIGLDNAKGELMVKTSGGNISINRISGSLDAHTSGGNIRAEVTGLEKYLNLSTSGGNITASIPEDKGLDLDIQADNIDANFKLFKGHLGKEKVQGSVNGGGIPVKMRTSGGNISLN